ncbi:MAG: hypothetical protein P1U65_07695 [Minwuia sp.]|nr:hypothetical protein [Minwuia sp.]
MSTSRIKSYRPRRAGTVKDVFADLIENAGGLRAAAAISRLGKSRLGEIASPHAPESQPPVDVVLSLELATGTSPVTAHMAAVQGRLLIDLGIDPAALGDADVALMLRINADAVKAAAETISHQMDAAADGVIEQAEAVACLPHVEQALHALALLRQLLLQVAPDDDA